MAKKDDEMDAPMDLALAAIDEIEAAGMIVLPVIPTRTMICAGRDAGGISPEKAAAVYRAMIGAAP